MPPGTAAVPATCGQIDGTVKVWSARKGFGFVAADTGEDYFVHTSDLGGRCLIKGGRIRFDVRPHCDQNGVPVNDGKYRAVNISGDGVGQVQDARPESEKVKAKPPTLVMDGAPSDTAGGLAGAPLRPPAIAAAAAAAPGPYGPPVALAVGAPLGAGKGKGKGKTLPPLRADAETWVTVPHGLQPGQRALVQVAGYDYAVDVPIGLAPGGTFLFECPGEAYADAAAYAPPPTPVPVAAIAAGGPELDAECQRMGRDNGGEPQPQPLDEEGEALKAEWVAAKRARNYAAADSLRAQLSAKGVRCEEAWLWEGDPDPSTAPSATSGQCRAWSRDGSCRFGAHCNFRHDLPPGGPGLV